MGLALLWLRNPSPPVLRCRLADELKHFETFSSAGKKDERRQCAQSRTFCQGKDDTFFFFYWNAHSDVGSPPPPHLRLKLRDGDLFSELLNIMFTSVYR